MQLKSSVRCGVAALSFLHHTPRCYSMMGAAKAKYISISSSRRLSSRNDIDFRSITNVAIVGGGLAGLSAAYHLLDISQCERGDNSRGMQITIFDKAGVGEGGASSVAGG